MLPFMRLADIGLFARSAKTDAWIRASWSDGGAVKIAGPNRHVAAA